MARNPFGWSYPAGAEHDPRAPYNEPDLPEECLACGEPNYEDGSPVHDGVFCSQECENRWDDE